MISGKSPSAVTQSLNNLAGEGAVVRICRGLWAERTSEQVSPYAVIPYLFPRGRSYVSFISALHLHGIIEQIPQVTTLASTSHARTIRTNIGTFEAHHIGPSFFAGFGWYKNSGNFLIAEPEKALIDSLYLSAHRKRQFGHFPELRFPGSFNVKKARAWAGRISNKTTRTYVERALKDILKKSGC